jgi:hypothetical protein
MLYSLHMTTKGDKPMTTAIENPTMQSLRTFSLFKGQELSRDWERATVVGWNEDVSKVYVQYSTSHRGLTCVLDAWEVGQWTPVAV